MLYRSSRLWKQGSSPSEVVRGGVSPFCPEEILAVDFRRLSDCPGREGKAFIVGVENVFFNISHSGDYVVCSVSDREIGIDIEKRAKARMEVAGRFFHEEEMAILKTLEGDKQDQLFFNYWSVKESFLKYIGTGLTRPLNSFVVRFAGENISLYEGVNKLPLRVNACPIDSGYACYVCGEYNDLPHLREITFEEIALSYPKKVDLFNK